MTSGGPDVGPPTGGISAAGLSIPANADKRLASRFYRLKTLASTSSERRAHPPPSAGGADTRPRRLCENFPVWKRQQKNLWVGEVEE